MNHSSDRPLRTRLLYTTMELCRNVSAGPNGSLELIVSGMRSEYPTYYYWPLTTSQTLTSDQLQDLIAVVGRELSETVMTRLNVQDEIPGLLST